MTSSHPADDPRAQRVRVPVARWSRWCDNFAVRHGRSEYAVEGGALRGDAADGSWFRAALPLGEPYAGGADPSEFAAAAGPSGTWGVLLVRKGGFAVARLEGARIVESKVGQRHVQGRTKAGGQSQQRFARRRDNQARQAYEAAAGHAARVLDGVERVVVGGDRSGVDEVLTDARLSRVTVVGTWHAVPDPRRSVLEGVVTEVLTFEVLVLNA
ncbi:MAG: acVLRF1 family peptidyl-tRNA hydrolase [Nocardioides sp.]|uniref:acVLRF1 family peptidyl-tRNA hydrolase n=1 Tax=Nocardioides sp. TaxID=35761 RepID=UPI003F09A04D